jgi:membrane protein DedA with SNARE-associated domain
VHALIEQLARHGLPLVFANVLLEQLGLPVPAIPTLIAAGALSAGGRLSTAALLALAVLASLMADSLWYLLGRRHGYRILKTVCGISLSPDSCVRQTESVFERHGAGSLLYAKFIPGFSTVAPPLAGALRVGFVRFALFDAGGALLWAGSGVAAGIVFHRAIDRVAEFLEGLGLWAVAITGALFVAFVAWKWWQRRRFYRFLRMARITPAQLRALIDAGKAPVIVDVRNRAAVQRDPRRIPGAIQLMIEEIDKSIDQLPPDREIVLYCT